MIFVIDDDLIMARCVKRAIDEEVMIFTNAVEAMEEITKGTMPDLIFLDVLLDGPDGFTFLHEMVSYQDTRRVPIVLVSSLDFKGRDFSEYGVVGILNKDTMAPQEIKKYVAEWTK